MHALSQVSGVKPSTASSLLALVTPVLLGMLKKNGFSARARCGSLTSMLLGQREHLQSAGLDDRITSALGFASLPNMLGSLPSAAEGYAKSAASTATAAASTHLLPQERTRRNWQSPPCPERSRRPPRFVHDRTECCWPSSPSLDRLHCVCDRIGEGIQREQRLTSNARIRSLEPIKQYFRTDLHSSF